MPVERGKSRLRQSSLYTFANVFQVVAICRTSALIDGVAPTDKSAGFYEPCFLKRCERNENAGTIGQAVSNAVWLRFQNAADLNLCLAQPETITWFKAKPLKKHGVSDCSAASDVSSKRTATIDHNVANERISRVNCFEFDERLIAAVKTPGHGSQGRSFACTPQRLNNAPLIRRRTRVHACEREIAAKDSLPLAVKSGA